MSEANQTRRWLLYLALACAFVAVLFYLRRGDDSPGSGGGASVHDDPKDHAAIVGQPGESERPMLPGPHDSTRDSPTAISEDSTPNPNDEFGLDLPPPELPAEGYVPPARDPETPLSDKERLAKRDQAVALLDRRIAAMVTQLGEAEAAGDTEQVAKLRVRLERMREQREWTANRDVDAVDGQRDSVPGDGK